MSSESQRKIENTDILLYLLPTDAADDSDLELFDPMLGRPLADTPQTMSISNGKEALENFISKAVKPFGMELDIYVRRGNDLLRKHKNLAFDITKPPNVEFADESGVDGGGVSREYFFLLMESLCKTQDNGLRLFDGQRGHLVPSHNYDFVSGGLFVIIGKMILHALLNNCNGVPGILPAVVSYLISGKRDAVVAMVCLQDVPDFDLRKSLEKVLSS